MNEIGIAARAVTRRSTSPLPLPSRKSAPRPFCTHMVYEQRYNAHHKQKCVLLTEEMVVASRIKLTASYDVMRAGIVPSDNNPT